MHFRIFRGFGSFFHAVDDTAKSTGGEEEKAKGLVFSLPLVATRKIALLLEKH
jgi:hypothetical protein